MSEHALTTVTFESLDLPPALLQGTKDAGFNFCTRIQAEALPHALKGHDVEGQAQTGTGKSAAFLLATMNHLMLHPPAKDHKNGDPRALIFAPTRELAVQIHKDALVLGKHTGLRIGVVFGGTGYEQQREMLHAGLDILIGTPGRAIDYLKQRIYSLDGIQVVVMDEADRMFDLGFIKDIRFVLRRMPPPEDRLNMLFSATLSMRVSELAYEHMNSPTVINANPDQVTVSNVTQVLYHVSNEDKIPLLLGVLQRIETTRTMVFVNTKRAAEKVEAYLEGNGIQAGLLTGDVPQRKRLALLEQFTSGKLPVLVATDVASRGLHIPDVSHVLNFDLPQDAEDYVHRVGRTARAGASGDAVSFACESYVYSLMDIEAFIGSKIPTAPITEGLLVKPKPPARRERRHRSPPPGSGRGRPRGATRRMSAL
jgi:ATP-dependent RNA helicase RhlB